MKFILGTKLEMTQLFTEGGLAVPVTKILATPCTAIQVKTTATDGYAAVQFAYGIRRAKNIAKPQIGHFKKTNVSPRYVREMRVATDSEASVIQPGQTVDVTSFAAGDIVNVTGVSKGRGFAGVVKRHSFSGGRKTHGNKDQLRMPGSIGAKGPAHVFKGTRMGGHMGDEQVSVKNLEIVRVDAAEHCLYIKGGVPGARNGLVIIKGEGELNIQENKKTNKQEESATTIPHDVINEASEVAVPAVSAPVAQPNESTE